MLLDFCYNVYMANENKKDFNAMLQRDNGMPKTQIVTDEKVVKRYGGNKMFFAPPLTYDTLMKQVPVGKVTTVASIRHYLSTKNNADFTDPLTAGIFISIAAWASYQRKENLTPYWRTLKTNGELNPKYPGGIEKQKALLEAEGHTIIPKGKKHIRYFVKEYENALFDTFNI